MRLLRTVLIALALAGAAQAQTVVVHPFLGEGTVLGAVVADRIAEALERDADLVVGPAAAPALVPPFSYADGYVGPLALVEDGGMARLHGAMLLRAGTGVDMAVSGRVVTDAGGLRLDLVAAAADGTTVSTTLRAPEDDPAELARRAAALLSARLDLRPPPPPAPIDMAGADDALGRAVTLLAGGFADEVDALVERAEDAGTVSPRLRELASVLDDVRAGRPVPGRPALAATLALTVLEDGERTMAYLAGLAGAGVPAADAWIGAVAADGGDLARADDAYARAASGYPYGAAALASYELAQDRAGASEALAALAASDDPAVLVVVALLADVRADAALEREALQALARATPTFAWPFERLSYLAFDDDDGLAAARALAVAVDLQPDNDLYWTNLGWAWYLLGLWDRSEEASERALELRPGATIAAYNLGLVRARFGRLDEAMPPYERALSADPDVDDEALADIVNAIAERPEEPALHYALARLYETEGRRDDAAEAYRTFLDLGGWGAPYDEAAERRLAVLTAPPPPLEIGGDRLDLVLGGGRIEPPLRPGDPIGLRFEALTPGEALPLRLEVTATLEDPDGDVLVRNEVSVDVPADAIGYVIEEAGIELPSDLAPGAYLVTVTLTGDGDTRAEIAREVEVAGQPEPLRRLIGRNVVLTSLASGRPLYGPDDADREDAVVTRLIDELRAAAEAAEESLPTAESGRFAGLSGATLFETSDDRDVRDFLAFLAAEQTSEVRATFVDVYAQWALDGAPTP
ncbi:MAG: tetratricopeptide repeat protein [Trueperaceae bacterium]|nr:tetratricopeptide repeat protein [Trueperaceae bacterium]